MRNYLLPAFFALLLSGCGTIPHLDRAVCRVEQRYNDCVDDVTDCNPCLDGLYCEHLDVTRYGNCGCCRCGRCGR